MTISDRSPRSPLLLVLAAAAITMGLVVWHSWADYDDMVTHSAEVTQATKTSACTARILHLDEVLTMSARMAAATGDKAWIDRYRQFEPELDNLIKEAKSLTPTAEDLGGASTTDKANEELVRMEKASFELVLQGKQDEAWALLTGPEYMRQKHIYAAGMDAFVKEIESRRQNASANRQRHLLLFQIAQCTIAIVVLGLWYFILRKVASAWRGKADQHRALADSLRVSEKRYRILFESSRDALMTLAPPSWKFTSGNPATVKLFGTKDAAEFTALGPWDLSPERQPDGRPSAEKAKEMIETAMREGSHLFEWTHKRLGGEDFPATVLLTRMELAGQTLLQATVRDITAQKQAEDAAAKENAKLSAMISGMDEGVVFANADNVVVEVNDYFCRFVGKPREAILGSRIEDIHSSPVLERVLGLIHKFRSNPKSEPFIVQRPVGKAEVMLRVQPIYRAGRYDGALLNVVNVTELVRARQAVEDANRRLEELATTDDLTGLANRRRFMEVLEAEFQRSRRYGGQLALAMVDVDRFKSFNDAHGHAFGDRVLVEVAKRLVAEARQTDVVARLGGDEFVILMPETSADEAVQAAERIRKAVSKDPLSDGERSVPATISVGIGTVENAKAGTPESLLKQADDAMYAAKESGRNRVCLVPSEKAVSPAP
ncbi:MAG TPA: sensor domain-containing diguanylate cyclase [Phycisphaerae bacterium]|nr:sensor domain-containing diguanylate cyclase [Phycisphaerae bacterium]